eukprot:5655323-Pyramimonas_sp.AAC.1
MRGRAGNRAGEKVGLRPRWGALYWHAPPREGRAALFGRVPPRRATDLRKGAPRCRACARGGGAGPAALLAGKSGRGLGERASRTADAGS